MHALDPSGSSLGSVLPKRLPHHEFLMERRVANGTASYDQPDVLDNEVTVFDNLDRSIAAFSAQLDKLSENMDLNFDSLCKMLNKTPRRSPSRGKGLVEQHESNSAALDSPSGTLGAKIPKVRYTQEESLERRDTASILSTMTYSELEQTPILSAAVITGPDNVGMSIPGGWHTANTSLERCDTHAIASSKGYSEPEQKPEQAPAQIPTTGTLSAGFAQSMGNDNILTERRTTYGSTSLRTSYTLGSEAMPALSANASEIQVFGQDTELLLDSSLAEGKMRLSIGQNVSYVSTTSVEHYAPPIDTPQPSVGVRELGLPNFPLSPQYGLGCCATSGSTSYECSEMLQNEYVCNALLRPLSSTRKAGSLNLQEDPEGWSDQSIMSESTSSDISEELETDNASIQMGHPSGGVPGASLPQEEKPSENPMANWDDTTRRDSSVVYESKGQKTKRTTAPNSLPGVVNAPGPLLQIPSKLMSDCDDTTGHTGPEVYKSIEQKPVRASAINCRTGGKWPKNQEGRYASDSQSTQGKATDYTSPITCHSRQQVSLLVPALVLNPDHSEDDFTQDNYLSENNHGQCMELDPTLSNAYKWQEQAPSLVLALDLDPRESNHIKPQAKNLNELLTEQHGTSDSASYNTALKQEQKTAMVAASHSLQEGQSESDSNSHLPKLVLKGDATIKSASSIVIDTSEQKPVRATAPNLLAGDSRSKNHESLNTSVSHSRQSQTTYSTLSKIYRSLEQVQLHALVPEPCSDGTHHVIVRESGQSRDHDAKAHVLVSEPSSSSKNEPEDLFKGNNPVQRMNVNSTSIATYGEPRRMNDVHASSKPYDTKVQWATAVLSGSSILEQDAGVDQFRHRDKPLSRTSKPTAVASSVPPQGRRHSPVRDSARVSSVLPSSPDSIQTQIVPSNLSGLLETNQDGLDPSWKPSSRHSYSTSVSTTTTHDVSTSKSELRQACRAYAAKHKIQFALESESGYKGDRCTKEEFWAIFAQRYPNHPCSGMTVIPENQGESVLERSTSELVQILSKVAMQPSTRQCDIPQVALPVSTESPKHEYARAEPQDSNQLYPNTEPSKAQCNRGTHILASPQAAERGQNQPERAEAAQVLSESPETEHCNTRLSSTTTIESKGTTDWDTLRARVDSVHANILRTVEFPTRTLLDLKAADEKRQLNTSSTSTDSTVQVELTHAIERSLEQDAISRSELLPRPLIDLLAADEKQQVETNQLGEMESNGLVRNTECESLRHLNSIQGQMHHHQSSGGETVVEQRKAIRYALPETHAVPSIEESLNDASVCLKSDVQTCSAEHLLGTGTSTLASLANYGSKRARMNQRVLMTDPYGSQARASVSLGLSGVWGQRLHVPGQLIRNLKPDQWHSNISWNAHQYQLSSTKEAVNWRTGKSPVPIKEPSNGLKDCGSKHTAIIGLATWRSKRPPDAYTTVIKQYSDENPVFSPWESAGTIHADSLKLSKNNNPMHVNCATAAINCATTHSNTISSVSLQGLVPSYNDLVMLHPLDGESTLGNLVLTIDPGTPMHVPGSRNVDRLPVNWGEEPRVRRGLGAEIICPSLTSGLVDIHQRDITQWNISRCTTEEMQRDDGNLSSSGPQIIRMDPYRQPEPKPPDPHHRGDAMRE